MSITHYQELFRAPKNGKPLVFAFHGTGGDEHQFYSLAQQLVPGGGVVSPRGDVSESGAARFFKRTGEGAYDFNDLALRTQKMTEYIGARKKAYPESEVYAFGYSNGANILASVAMANPDLFDRIALLHPLVTWDPGTATGLAEMPVLITAGRRDPITPWDKSIGLMEWFEAQGAKVTVDAHDGGHELRQSELASIEKFFSD